MEHCSFMEGVPDYPDLPMKQGFPWLKMTKCKSHHCLGPKKRLPRNERHLERCSAAIVSSEECPCFAHGDVVGAKTGGPKSYVGNK